MSSGRKESVVIPISFRLSPQLPECSLLRGTPPPSRGLAPPLTSLVHFLDPPPQEVLRASSQGSAAASGDAQARLRSQNREHQDPRRSRPG